MLLNTCKASIRHLARNRLYATISIVGLSIGLCGAMLASLVLRHDLSFDSFIPDCDRVYLAASKFSPPGRAPTYWLNSPVWLGELMRLRFSAIEAVTRLLEETVEVHRGSIAAKEKLCWADANLFEVLPVPVAFGNLKQALQRPEGLVLTRASARKYFGRDDPLGDSLQIGAGHLMTVAAVIDDLPANETFQGISMFASARAAGSAWSKLGPDATDRGNVGSVRFPGRTYLQLARNASIDRLFDALPAFTHSAFPDWMADRFPSIELVRIDKLHVHPGFHPESGARMAVVAGAGALILVIGVVNFVILTTARSARRTVEVGIRKAAGASRRTLMLQFLGESLAYVLLAALVSVAVTEWLLPRVNAFLDTGATFEYWRDPALIESLVGGVILLALLAGAYPALLLASFRPAHIVKGPAAGSSGGERMRQALVALQFAIMIGLLVGAGVTQQQLTYATHGVLRLDTDQMLVVRAQCNDAFETQLQRLSGVLGVACASESFLESPFFGGLRMRDGSRSEASFVEVQPGLLELFGLKPASGRFFSPSDPMPRPPDPYSSAGPMVLNQAAARRLGFASGEAAVGQSMTPYLFPTGTPAEIIGTVSDFSLAPVTQPVNPTIYTLGRSRLNLTFVKLRGRDIPETLTALDRLWHAVAPAEPIDRFFLDEHIQQLYLSVRRETQTLGVLSVCALLLACLGLFGLAASAIERRTKEVGIRKAMGASTGDVTRGLLWRFTRPVLWGTLIAWPVAALLLNRWLHGFAYHVELDPLIFLAASSIALLVAVLTVSAHCYRVGRENPTAALRYE
jgi:putative ABC transport system permease protein